MNTPSPINCALLTPSKGNHYCNRKYTSTSEPKVTNGGYHYSNTNGSYYYQNPDGSKYYNDGQGFARYTKADGTGWEESHTRRYFPSEQPSGGYTPGVKREAVTPPASGIKREVTTPPSSSYGTCDSGYGTQASSS